MPELYATDTTVLTFLTAPESPSHAYGDIIGQGRIALSFQTLAEVAAIDVGARRAARLQTIVDQAIELPHSGLTSDWYAVIWRVRRSLRPVSLPGRDAGDADIWILASAAEYGLSLLSHDRQQVALGRACGLRVYTLLPRLRAENPS